MKISINHKLQKSQICFDNKLIINVTRIYINVLIKTLCNLIIFVSTKFHNYKFK